MSKREKALKRWLLREASQKLRPSALTKTAASHTLSHFFLNESTQRTERIRDLVEAGLKTAGRQSGTSLRKKGGENYQFKQYAIPEQRIRALQKELADKFGKVVYGIVADETAKGYQNNYVMSVGDVHRYAGESSDNAFPISPSVSTDYRAPKMPPSNVHFVFGYEASVMPVNRPESQKTASDVVKRATEIFQFPFEQFIQDIQAHRLALNAYFQKSSWGAGEGQVGDAPWAMKLVTDITAPQTVERAVKAHLNKQFGLGNAEQSNQLIKQLLGELGGSLRQMQSGNPLESFIMALNQAMTKVFGNVPGLTLNEFIDHGMLYYNREAKEFVNDQIVRSTQPRQPQDKERPLDEAWTLSDVTLENAIKNRRRCYTVDPNSLMGAIRQLKQRAPYVNEKELQEKITEIDRMGCVPVIVEKIRDMFDADGNPVTKGKSGEQVSVWQMRDPQGNRITPMDILKGVLGKKLAEKRIQKRLANMRSGTQYLELDPTDINPDKAIQATEQELQQANIQLEPGQMAILISLPRSRRLRIPVEELKQERYGDYSFDEFGNIQQNVIYSGEQMRGSRCPIMTNDELRVYLLSLTKKRPGMDRYPEGIIVNDRPITYANGLSTYLDPSTNSVRTNWLLPSMRILPNSQMVPDTDNGNCLMDHIRLNWSRDRGGINAGLKPFLMKWGKRCTELMREMVTFSGKAQAGIRAAQWRQKESPADEIIAQVIAASIGDGKHRARTNADEWLDLLQQRPSMDSPDPHKGLRNLIATPQRGAIAYAYECAAAAQRTPPQLAPEVQRAFDWSIQNKKILSVVSQLRQQLNQKAQQYAQNNRLADTPLAAEINAYCQYLTQAFIDQKMGWDDLSTSLVQLTNLDTINSTGFGATGLDNQQKSTLSNMNEQDYQLLKSYAWGTGKLMDFVSALMHRSCTTEEEVVDPETNEKFTIRECGDNYVSSSGTTGGGKIIVGMRVSYSAPIVQYQMSKRPVPPQRNYDQERQQFDLRNKPGGQHYLDQAERDLVQQAEQQAVGSRTITFVERIDYTLGQVSLDDGNMRSAYSADNVHTLLSLLQHHYPSCPEYMISNLRTSIDFARNGFRLAADKVKTMLDYFNGKNPQNAVKTIVVFEHEDGSPAVTIESQSLGQKDRLYQNEIYKMQNEAGPQQQRQQPPAGVKPPPTAPKPPAAVTPLRPAPTQTAPAPRPPPVPAAPALPTRASMIERLIKVADEMDKRHQTGLVGQLEVLIKELKRIPA